MTEETCTGKAEDSPLTTEELGAIEEDIYTLLAAEPGEYRVGHIYTEVEYEPIHRINTNRTEEDTICVEVSVDRAAVGTEIISDERPNASASRLRDLGPEFECLEFDIRGQITHILDIPIQGAPSDESDHFDTPDQLCATEPATGEGSDYAVFVLSFHIPEVVRALNNHEGALMELSETLAVN